MGLPLDLKTMFPALTSPDTVYLDNASTTQVPKQVLEVVFAYESQGRGNPQRGLYTWASQAADRLQRARQTVARFVGAQAQELTFTKGTTEGLNLLARALSQSLKPQDEVVVTIFEHHANLLPWRELAGEFGFKLKYLPMAEDGSLDLNFATQVIGSNTRVVSLALVSNVLGTILPVAEVAKLAHEHGAAVMVDAAQAVGHLPVDVKALECEALVFGAHKMYGPEGIGAMYVKDGIWKQIKPLIYGGGMVDEVSDEEIKYATDSRLFEAGSSNVGGAIGLAAACEFLEQLGLNNVREHEQELTAYLKSQLKDIPGLTIYSPQPAFGQVGVVSFSLAGLHPHDVAQILADQGIAVRAGYHCAEPLTRCLNPGGTVRVSVGVYNTREDIERLKQGLEQVRARLAPLVANQA